jgi:hypothetical protein
MRFMSGILLIQILKWSSNILAKGVFMGFLRFCEIAFLLRQLKFGSKMCGALISI